MMKAAERPTAPDKHVAGYKSLLHQVLDRRPSGTRQRLAQTLGKNRSFISLISNPNHPTPIPAQHIDVIFEVCHFSPQEREHFLSRYREAHPRRLLPFGDHERTRHVTLTLPDLGDDGRNRRLDAIIAEFARATGKLLR